MKKILLLILTFGFFYPIWAQDITGDWHGYLKDFKLRIVFHVTESENGLESTLDSPDQGAHGIPTSATIFEDTTLTITVSTIGATFTGELANDVLEGTFHFRVL